MPREKHNFHDCYDSCELWVYAPNGLRSVLLITDILFHQVKCNLMSIYRQRMDTNKLRECRALAEESHVKNECIIVYLVKLMTSNILK